MRLAQAMGRLGTETAFEVLARARALEAQGVDVIHLEIGEPDFDTPPHIVEAAVDALRQGYTHYGPAPGLPELRQAIAEEVAVTRGIPVDINQVVVTPGAKPIMFFALLALCEPGDEVVYPNPGFPIYESMINFVGAKPVPAPLREEIDFRLDLNDLAAKVNDRTRLIIINSPQNPTGGILLEDDIKEIARLAIRHNCWVLSDEVYRRIIYAGEPKSIASLPGMAERTIILDGLSKTYAMTGWRLGYGVMPAPLAAQMAKLSVNSFSCVAAFSQRAALAALQGPQDAVTAMVEEFRRRRDLIVDGLNAIPGIHCVQPQGAFYVFPNVSAVATDSKAFADDLLARAGVAALSGTAFGAYGEGHIRLSYANSQANIKKALERIADAVVKLRA